MPVINVNVWKGFGEDKAKIVIEGITKVFMDLGVPKIAIQVIIHEIPMTHWGVGGQPASEKFKKVRDNSDK